ncbi:substrate-binding domain-containing protein [Anaeromicropila populeti]|uniref:D-xylose transport system substrate-binding protein n=1 Tax=Anaeromicropila populeti TaxID=37658 RepID=A0A1I6K001_9FIRM|nr:substrate-binding domain-containing protein [Anaeromicropila populeti]SFR84521.1 D-xylose transport system substrate-binding protein [Anaeromicropila populeti]
MVKKIAAILILFTAVIALGGCSKEKEDSKEQNVEESKIQIGLSFDSFVIERWQRDRDVFVSTANELGAEVNVQIANGDVEKQISQIKYLIDKKVDVIVIIPVDAKACTDVLKKARSEGIKIVAYDRLVCDARADLYISFDNKEVGRLMGKALSDSLPDGGNIITVFGPKTDYNVTLLEEGFYEYIEDKNLKVVYSAYADDWQAEEAYAAVNEALIENPDINGILCGNDDLASQAVRALSENRLAGKVVVTGQDADLAACQRIVEETQEMTVYKPVDKLAKSAAEYVVKLANNEAVEAEEVINDGTYDVPYVKLEPIAVTKENMNSVIIEGGFQQKEDVYLNVPELMN